MLLAIHPDLADHPQYLTPPFAGSSVAVAVAAEMPVTGHVMVVQKVKVFLPAVTEMSFAAAGVLKVVWVVVHAPLEEAADMQDHPFVEFLESAESCDQEIVSEKNWAHSCETGEKRHFGHLMETVALKERHNFQKAGYLSLFHRMVDLCTRLPAEVPDSSSSKIAKRAQEIPKLCRWVPEACSRLNLDTNRKGHQR